MKILLSKSGMAAALSAPVLVTSPDALTSFRSQQDPVLEESVSAPSCYSEVISRAFADDEIRTRSEMLYYLPDQEWSENLEHQFHKLAVAEATETLTGEQAAELESLTRLRALKTPAPKSLDEIVREIQQWKAAVSLLSQLSNYVRIVGPRT